MLSHSNSYFTRTELDSGDYRYVFSIALSRRPTEDAIVFVETYLRRISRRDENPTKQADGFLFLKEKAKSVNANYHTQQLSDVLCLTVELITSPNDAMEHQLRYG